MYPLQRNRVVVRCCLLVLIAMLAWSELFAAPRIAIIIDDLGYQRVAGERAIALPGPVAFAILPDTPRDTYFANLAHAAGKEVLLHLPLQAEHDRSGSGENNVPGEEIGAGLLLDMNQRQIAEAFAHSIAAVPFAVGVNNHRGSLLTRHPGHMSWLMQAIRGHGDLFFIDSYTTAESVALKVALENGVPALRRDVFLDPDLQPGTLSREFSRLKKLASERGFAVGIGHPHAETLAFLETALPTLANDGYEMISISELIAAQSAADVTENNTD